MKKLNTFNSSQRVLEHVAIALISLGLFQLASQARTWTNIDGTMIEADFVEMRDGGNTVRLRKTEGINSGKLFDVPLSNLSPADRAYLGFPDPDPDEIKTVDPTIAALQTKLSSDIKKLNKKTKKLKKKGKKDKAKKLSKKIKKLKTSLASLG